MNKRPGMASIVCLAFVWGAFAHAGVESPPSGGAPGQLDSIAKTAYGGSGARLAEEAGGPYDGGGPSPAAAVDAGSGQGLASVPLAQPRLTQEESGDPAQRPPDGFQDLPDDKPKPDPGFWGKAWDWTKKDLPGWMFKCGVVVAALGLFTALAPISLFGLSVSASALMWTGFSLVLGSGVLTAVFS